MSVNLNNTTPAAPASNTNVTWQSDASGNISAYFPTTSTIASADATAQVANIALTTLFTPTVSGIYKVLAYIIVTQAATTSSTLPNVQISFTDQDNSTAQTINLNAAGATTNSLTTMFQEAIVISAKTSIAIQYQTGNTAAYASVGATAMQYALHIRLQQV